MLAPLALTLVPIVPQATGPTSFDAFRAGLSETVRIGLVRDTKRIDLDVLERFVDRINEGSKTQLVLIDGWGDEERQRAVKGGIDVAAVVRKAKISKGRPQTIAYGTIGAKSGLSVRYVGVAVDLKIDLVGAFNDSDWTQLGRWEVDADYRRAPRNIDRREVVGAERTVAPEAVIEWLIGPRLAEVGEICRVASLDTPSGRLTEWYPRLTRDEQLAYWRRAWRESREEVALPFTEMDRVGLEHWRALKGAASDAELTSAIRDFASLSLSRGAKARGERISIRSRADLERVLEDRQRSFELWEPASFPSSNRTFVVVRDDIDTRGWLLEVPFPDVFRERVLRLTEADLERAGRSRRALRKIDGAAAVVYSDGRFEVTASLEPEEVTAESVAALLRDSLAPRWPSDE